MVESKLPTQDGRSESGLAPYLQPRMLVILALGFSSGLPLALTGQTLQYWLGESKIDLTTIGFFALAGLSYSLKFIWSPIMDRLMPPGFFGLLGRRRGWVLFSQILLALSIAGMGLLDPATQTISLALAAVLVAFFSASQDIVIDGFRIEYLEAREQAIGAAMTIYGYQFSSRIISGALALYIAEYYGWNIAYLCMASFMIIGMVAILLIKEPARSEAIGKKKGAVLRLASPVGAIGLATILFLAALAIVTFLVTRDHVLLPLGVAKWLANFIATLMAAIVPVLGVILLPRPSRGGAYRQFSEWLEGAVIRPFADFGTIKGWQVILLFVVLYKLGDAVLGVLAGVFYLDMGFSKPEIANVTKTFGLFATLFGTFLGGMLAFRLGIARALIISAVLQGASNLIFSWQAYIGYDLEWFYVTIAVENITGGMGGVVLVAYLSGLCNVAFSATQYALLSSVASLGRTLLSAPFGGVAEEVGWITYFIISTFMAVPGLLLLVYMMYRYPEALRARKAERMEGESEATA